MIPRKIVSIAGSAGQFALTDDGMEWYWDGSHWVDLRRGSPPDREGMDFFGQHPQTFGVPPEHVGASPEALDEVTGRSIPNYPEDRDPLATFVNAEQAVVKRGPGRPRKVRP